MILGFNLKRLFEKSRQNVNCKVNCLNMLRAKWILFACVNDFMMNGHDEIVFCLSKCVK